MFNAVTPRDRWPSFATLPVDVQARLDQKLAFINESVDQLLAITQVEIDAGGSQIDLWGIVGVYISESATAAGMASANETFDADAVRFTIVSGLAAALALRMVRESR